MPAAYDAKPDKFEALMREVCPPRSAIARRIDELRARWEIEDEEAERREIAKAFQGKGAK